MKREEILKQAIEKAVENGWHPIKVAKEITHNDIRNRVVLCLAHGIENTLFDHSFCKAFAKYINKTGQADKLNYVGVLNKIDGLTTGNLYDVERSFKIELVCAKDRLEYISRFLK